ncbi:YveK family protein [Paenibacillus sp. 481]|uniref:YveK family protein n=1 Tax=Paenibacillus sp. 481 TaxID=2835869 RepID=UPI001E2E181F|nr:Wzz/FepE/Etk N-terminal domain-containing protein [Paenibacillus sp. 481]UHA71959.1 lipopolysaccharide biosynthesis protein [Paenibacillus sp. 481]
MELDLKHMLHTIWKRKWLVASIVLVAITASAYYSYVVLKPIYEASTKLIVNKTRIEQGESHVNLNDLNANIQLISTYKELVRTNWVVNDVLKAKPDLNMTAEQLLENIKVSSMNDTQVMTISVRDESYARAVDIVSKITEVFMVKIPQLMEVDNVTLLTGADPKANAKPVKPNPVLNITVVAAIALLISTATVFILQYFDHAVYSEEDVEGAIQLPTLVVVPKMTRRDFKKPNMKTRSQQEDDNYAASL